MSRQIPHLDGCAVVAEFEQGGLAVQVPDVQLVVVSTAGQLPVIRRPFEATHLQAQEGTSVRVYHGRFVSPAQAVWEPCQPQTCRRVRQQAVSSSGQSQSAWVPIQTTGRQDCSRISVRALLLCYVPALQSAVPVHIAPQLGWHAQRHGSMQEPSARVPACVELDKQEAYESQSVSYGHA